MSDAQPSSVPPLRITRVTNSCLLIQLGDHTILTDPWFQKPWGFNEEPGLRVDELPSLTAVVASHYAGDHFDIRALQGHPASAATRVFTCTRSMVKKARRHGFERSECLEWGDTREIAPGLLLEVVEAQRPLGPRSNNYVIEHEGVRVFFGGEAKELAPIRAYAEDHPPVDVVIAPVNGMRLLGLVRLVMTAEEAIECAEVLRAGVLIPIHDTQDDLILAGPTSSGDTLRGRPPGKPEVRFLPAGVPTAIALPPGR